jgi:methylated-DNA-[protein]-cysteine S-methyltransferase
MDPGADRERCYRSPIGVLGLRWCDSGLTAIRFLCEDGPGQACEPGIERELDRYFADPTHRCSLPLCPRGTPFQKRVWQLLQDIPSGTVLTYGELARRTSSSPRAVGGACGANPLPIVIPCHRVVAVHGLGGYAGRDERGLAIKRWLLRHERAIP